MRARSEGELVVDLVGKDDETVAAREFDDLQQSFARVESAGRIIRIDDDDAARLRRDLGCEFVDVRLPAIVFVEIVGRERRFELGEHGGVKRIFRAGREHGFVWVQQRCETHVDALADTAGDERSLNIANPFALGFAQDCLYRFVDAERGRVSVLAIAHGLGYGFDQVRRSLKVEFQRIADVERQDLRAGFCDFVGKNGEIADGVAHAVKAGGSGDGGQCCFAIKGHVGCSKPITVYVWTGRVASDSESHALASKTIPTRATAYIRGTPPGGTLPHSFMFYRLRIGPFLQTNHLKQTARKTQELPAKQRSCQLPVKAKAQRRTIYFQNSNIRGDLLDTLARFISGCE